MAERFLVLQHVAVEHPGVFRDFMREALRNVPPAPFRIPAGVRLVRIDYNTGLLPGPETTQTILETQDFHD